MNIQEYLDDEAERREQDREEVYETLKCSSKNCERYRKPRPWTWKSVTLVLLCGLGLGFGFRFTFDAAPYKIVGQSMFPEFKHGDWALGMNRFLWMPLDIEQGDVVCITDAVKDKILIKRVVAVPGDVVTVNGKNGTGWVFVNGKPYFLHSVLFDRTKSKSGKITLKLKDDEYFVLGDNRPISHDSRAFGPISRKQIESKVMFKWTPLTVH